MVKILDCTTRDGGSAMNWNFEDDHIFDLIRILNESAFSYFEIGYRNHIDNADKGRFYNCTPELLKKFYAQKGSLELGVMVDTKRFAQEDFVASENDFVDFVRVACHPEEIQKALEIADMLLSRGYKVFLQLMDASNIDADGYVALFGYENKKELESVYIADSYGTISPDEIGNYYNKLKMLGYEKISFHGHNKNFSALENTLKMIELGAYSVDVSQSGIGRNGGNLTAEELISKINL